MNKYIFLVSRLAGFFIDYIPYWILFFVLSKYGVAGYFISLCFLFLYRLIFSAAFGATPGMMALKLKLGKYDFKICSKREIYRFTTAFFFVGALYSIIDVNGRTLYDIASGTYVVYGNSYDVNQQKSKIINIIATVILVVEIVKWGSSFVLNDIGLIGLRKAYTSSEYYQTFDGDDLVSLSQDELYKKTMGRKYTAVIEISGEPKLIRISNKLKYTEVYKLNLKNNAIVGEFLYKIDLPLQFICSGQFNSSRDLCGVSPKNKIIISDSSGTVYGAADIKIFNIVTLKCGDIDNDGKDESVILNRDGEVEIFKYSNGKLAMIYSGKIGEDIIPETFYIDKSMFVLGESGDKSILFSYEYKDNKFIFKDKKKFNVEAVSTAVKFNNDIIISNVSRNNMAFEKGKIQRLEVYSTGEKIIRKYNFGTRPGRIYAYFVRSLEDAYDIDNDGKEEIIFKAVGKQDVQGQGYIVEIYKVSPLPLFLNRILSKIEAIIY